jgi:hypothetical protein
MVVQAAIIGVVLDTTSHSLYGCGLVDINQFMIAFTVTPTTRPKRNAGSSFFTGRSINIKTTKCK